MQMISDKWLLYAASGLMAVALFLQNLTLATQDTRDYRVVLLAALGCMAVADVCCAALIWRGGWARWFGLLVAAPTVLIVVDFASRAPGTFG